MTDEHSRKPGLKQRAIHESLQFLGIFLYLLLFFCVLAAYTMVVAHSFRASEFTFGAALLNAFVIAKVILIGEYARLGKKHEARPLIFSAFYKAFLFTLLVLVFHFVEELLKRQFRGESFASAWQRVPLDEFLVRCAIVFCTFIPLFAFRELQRVLGFERFRELFFSTSTPAK
jgi:hypothetical protein